MRRSSAGLGRVQVVLQRQRIRLSPAPLLEGKRARLALGGLLVLIACGAAALVGLHLARRMRRPLDAVMAALRQVRHQRFDVTMEPAAVGELRELQDAILDMSRALDAAHRHLEDQVVRRTQELEAALHDLQTADAEKRRLIARGNELVEHERSRLSREIHDELNAALVAIRLQASALAAGALSEGNAETHAAALRISSLTDEVYQRARSIVTGLRPELLDTLGLAGAIEEVVRHFDEVHAECRFEFRSLKALPRVPERIAIAAYRIAQEALSNVAKHAHATRCEVSLDTADLEGRRWLRLVVADNGQGFDPRASSPQGLGLIGMRERVMALEGSMEVSSDAGTTLTIVVPLPMPAEA